jgi:NO-binding membrane sensor protein with MHYT domain
MVEVSHFTYGWINPALGFGLSFIGSLLGLLCAARAREAVQRRSYALWIALAAISLGGTGIWLAHFLMMLGFTAASGPLRYDVQLTAVSAAVAVGVAGTGLLIAGRGKPSLHRLLAGGIVAGLGAAAMHYTGMLAMHVRGLVRFEPALIAVSVLIAIAAATAALWFTVAARTPGTIAAAGLTMATAVTAMHYTGMLSVRVHVHDVPGQLPGSDPSGFLTTVTIFAAAAVITVLYFVLTAPDELERSASAGLRELLHTEMRQLAGLAPQPRRAVSPAEAGQPAAAPEKELAGQLRRSA